MTMNLSSFLQWRINIYLYLTFGWGVARMVIFLFCTLYFFFNRKEKGRIKDAVSEGMGRYDQETNMGVVTKRVLHGVYSHYYEKLFIAFERPKKAAAFLNHHVDTMDLEILEKSLSKGNGVILVTGHYGAIEYIPTLLAINGFSVSMIAKFKTEQLRRKVFSQAKSYNIRLIDANNTKNVIAIAFNELKKNQVLITQCDEIEEWKPSKREKTSFLGRTTGLDRSINIIQKRTGAEVVFGVIHRYNLEEYKLMMRDTEQMLLRCGHESPLSVGEAVLRLLEQFIYANPEQWYQWKKYLDIETPSSRSNRVRKLGSGLHLKPALGIAQ
ncbi:MAG: lysophospholipid acyltransferase family protein [Deltaproteobacteria bacterium]|nr:lysophospholipid acyltransferase family protein [Deltaproteobacteria bacterium]